MYVKSSTVESLLMLPGLMCDARIFADQLACFPQAIVAKDYGNAGNLTEMARGVLADAPDRFALLGHSMGARVALEILRLASDRVTRLAIASSGTHLPRAGEADARFALRDLGRRDGHAALVDAWLPPMVGPRQTDDVALYARLHAMCVDAGPVRFEAQIAALLTRPEVASLLPHIKVPTMVLTGSDDRWAPPDQHKAMAALIPGSRLVIVANAGHMLPAEKPYEFNAALADWLTLPTV